MRHAGARNAARPYFRMSTDIVFQLEQVTIGVIGFPRHYPRAGTVDLVLFGSFSCFIFRGGRTITLELGLFRYGHSIKLPYARVRRNPFAPALEGTNADNTPAC